MSTGSCWLGRVEEGAKILEEPEVGVSKPPFHKVQAAWCYRSQSFFPRHPNVFRSKPKALHLLSSHHPPCPWGLRRCTLQRSGRDWRAHMPRKRPEAKHKHFPLHPYFSPLLDNGAGGEAWKEGEKESRLLHFPVSPRLRGGGFAVDPLCFSLSPFSFRPLHCLN